MYKPTLASEPLEEEFKKSVQSGALVSMSFGRIKLVIPSTGSVIERGFFCGPPATPKVSNRGTR